MSVVCWPIKNSDTVVITSVVGVFGNVGRCQDCPDLMLISEISQHRLTQYHNIKLIPKAAVSVSYQERISCIETPFVDMKSNMTLHLKPGLSAQTLDMRRKDFSYIS